MPNLKGKPSAESLLKRENSLRSDRQQWDSLWDELAVLAMPSKKPVTSQAAPLEGMEVLDVTAREAVQEFAAGLYGYLTPPSQRWFYFQPSDPDMQNDEEVQAAFHKLTEIVANALATSNFYEIVHSLYVDHAWAGTANIYSDEDPKNPNQLRFLSFTPYDYVFDTDYTGKVDRIAVRFEYTPRQAAQRFGEKNLSEEMQGHLRDSGGESEKKFQFVHWVYPREYGKLADDAESNKEMPYASVWVEEKGKKIVEEKGYREMPYHVSRYSVANGEKYGTSPARTATPLIAFVNSQRRSMARASQRAAEPPWLCPSDGSVYNVSNKPNAMIYWQPDPNGMNKPEQMAFKGQLSYTLQDYQEDVSAIQRIFNVDLFRALSSTQGDRRTATEVINLISEQETLLSPFLGRLQRELFNPLMTRNVNLLFRTGVIPDEIKDVLSDAGGYEVQYTGKLALALKAQGIRGFQRAMQSLLPFAEMNPEVLEQFDWRKVTRGVSRGEGVPSEYMVDVETAIERAQARQEQQAAMAAAQAGGEAYKNTKDAPAEGSPAKSLMDEVNRGTL